MFLNDCLVMFALRSTKIFGKPIERATTHFLVKNVSAIFYGSVADFSGRVAKLPDECVIGLRTITQGINVRLSDLITPEDYDRAR